MSAVEQAPDDLSEEVARTVLEVLAPGSTLDRVAPLPGSYSNYTHVVQAHAASGAQFRFVIRRYAIFGSYDRGEKARREFKTLELLQEHNIPAPAPLILDRQGDLLGIAGIVTRYVFGRQVHEPSDPLAWARTLARTLAAIHSVPCDGAARELLLDADWEAVWFARSGSVPDYMLAHPDGEAVWQAVRDLLPARQPVTPGLVHLDYWPGNVLWQDATISAVVDWEEAAYGDPAIDVAYARMHMALDGLDRAADEFLAAYEAMVGRPVDNLGLWELAAAARPMYGPASWAIAEQGKIRRFKSFITNALQRSGV